MASTIWGRKEVGMIRTNKLFMSWAMLYNHPVNICYYLLDYLVSIAKNKSDDKGDIMVGGIIIFDRNLASVRKPIEVVKY